MMSRVSGDLVSCPAPSSFFAILGAELTLNNLSEFWVPPQAKSRIIESGLHYHRTIRLRCLRDQTIACFVTSLRETMLIVFHNVL